MALLIEDFFTASDGTLLGNHTTGLNTGWASNFYYGSGNENADEFVIQGNRLRRVEFGDPEGFAGGVALAYPGLSSDLDSLQHFDVSFDLTFTTGVVNSYTELYYNAQINDLFISPTLIVQFFESGFFTSEYGSEAYTFTPDQVYEIRVSRRGNNCLIFIDGIMVRAYDGFDPVGKIGIGMFDFNGEARQFIDNFALNDTAVAYYDDFSGSGTLSGYTNDSGYTYTAADSSSLLNLTRESDYVRDDAGTSARGAFASYGAGVGIPRIEFLALHVTSGSASSWFASFFLKHPDDGNSALTGRKLGARYRFLGSTTSLWLHDGSETTITDINPIAGAPSPLDNFIVHVQIDLDMDNEEVVLTFNGVEVHRAPMPVGLDIEGWRPFFYMSGPTLADTRLLYTSVSIQTPAEPEAFWTERTRTQEII